MIFCFIVKMIIDFDEIFVVIFCGWDLGFFVDDEEFIDGCWCVVMLFIWLDEIGVVVVFSIMMFISWMDEWWLYLMVEFFCCFVGCM